jgi:polyhydroxyalkanoate synthase
MAQRATLGKTAARKPTGKLEPARKKARVVSIAAVDATPRERGDANEAHDAGARAADATAERLAGQFGIGDLDPRQLVDTAREVAAQILRQPAPALKAGLGLMAELFEIAAGRSMLAPEPGDKRFADPTWQSWAYKGLMQGYLAWSRALQAYAHGYGSDPQERSRVEFLMAQIAAAAAPTNTLWGNPAALKKAFETGGDSCRRGLANLLGDLAKGRYVPSQSDDRPFRIGENMACTPGSVVLRTEMFELLEFAAQTPTVGERAMLLVPAIINKYYVFDLAPGRSLCEHFVRQGVRVFVVAWRNPGPEHDHWGAAEYQESVAAAIDAVGEISGVEDVNLWGVCGASPSVVSMAAWYAATGQRKVRSLTLVVPLLDMQSLTQTEGIGGFIDGMTRPKPARRRPPRRMAARDLSLLFGLLRPNDLIWPYWVGNYLMGNDPPTFDILTWNNDGTGMTAAFSQDFQAMARENPLVTPGAMQVRGTPIAALDRLGIDCYVVGALTDHICRWPGVYRSAQLLGERCSFVLGGSGHIQTLVCPPDNAKAAFYTNARNTAAPERWLETATKHAGSWWQHNAAWTIERAGRQVDAPTSQGSARHPPLGKAPGIYVLEKV